MQHYQIGAIDQDLLACRGYPAPVYGFNLDKCLHYIAIQNLVYKCSFIHQGIKTNMYSSPLK